MYANLDFETNIVQICCKLSEIYNFKIDNHSQFYKANFGNFWEVIFFFNYSSCQLSIDNYFSCECSDWLTKHLSALLNGVQDHQT